MMWECCLFILTFITLRTYAGGYHALTIQKCYVCTTLIVASSLSAIKYIPENVVIYVALLLLASLIIVLFSTVSSENKILDEVEKKIYRRKTYIRWRFETIIAIICILLEIEKISICIIMAQLVTGLFQLVEIIKDKRQYKN